MYPVFHKHQHKLSMHELKKKKKAPHEDKKDQFSISSIIAPIPYWKLKHDTNPPEIEENFAYCW